ncbi:hypothetical protein ACA910_016899 [Epithemia clementina (nom. ined.)]
MPNNEEVHIRYQPPHHESYGTDRMIDFEPLPARTSVYRRRSFINEFVRSDGPPQIVIVIMLFAFGFGSVIGVVPAVMSDRFARIYHGFDEEMHCTDYEPSNKPQACIAGFADAQNSVAVEQFISNTLTFFTSSLIGSLSDEYGRKRVLLLGVILAMLSPLFLLLIQLDDKMNPMWYYMAGAIQGLVNWIAVALSVLSDVMPKQWRAPSFGLVLAGLSMGFACAPLLALFLGHFYVTCLSISVVVVAFLIVLLFLPETLPPEAAESAKLARLAQVEELEGISKYLWFIYRPLWELSIINRSTLFRLLSALAFFSGISSSGDRSLFLYYIEERIGFRDKDIAVFFLVVGVAGIFVQGVFLKIINDALGEKRVIIFSFLVGAAHDLVYSLAKTKGAIYVSAVMASLLMMAFPTISAVKSNNVGESEQGRIQGALYSVQALSSALGPTLFRTVHHFSNDGSIFGPGSMFLFSASMYMVASYFACLLPPEANSKREETDADANETDDPSAPLTNSI